MSGSDHLRIALDLLIKAGIAANLTTDTQLAAYALEQQGRSTPTTPISPDSRP
ncbi:hypothetical protein [Nocardia paucivorans]|uniref:hypothetical protein n=1 Tax=Nocardia paucivorans TaxID=114259 RepID=UPI0012F77865|nr:hypothetical protein [Nocardia paucivorans]